MLKITKFFLNSITYFGVVCVGCFPLGLNVDNWDMVYKGINKSSWRRNYLHKINLYINIFLSSLPHYGSMKTFLLKTRLHQLKW